MAVLDLRLSAVIVRAMPFDAGLETSRGCLTISLELLEILLTVLFVVLSALTLALPVRAGVSLPALTSVLLAVMVRPMSFELELDDSAGRLYIFSYRPGVLLLWA